MKQMHYQWEGKDRFGRIKKGNNAANHVNDLTNELQKQGIKIIKARKKNNLFFVRIANRDITFFTRQLAVLLTAGIPLLSTFEIISHTLSNNAFQQLMGQLKNTIEKGSSFSQALKSHPKYFNSFYLNLVVVAEASGTLDRMLDRLATYREKIELLQRKIKKACMYPALIIFTSISIATFLLLVIVPQFQNIFSSFGVELPAATKGIILIANYLKSYGVCWLLIILGLFLGIYGLLHKYTALKKLLDRVLLKCPFIGKLLRNSYQAKFAETLATLLSAGLPIVAALQATLEISNNRIFNQAISQVREIIMQGTHLHRAMQQTKVFSKLFIQMVFIGEESGTLDHMLEKIAKIYTAEVDQVVENLSLLLEPLLMLVVGFIVGSVVLCLYLPIFKLGTIV